MNNKPGILKVLQAVAGKPITPEDDESLFTSGLLDSFALPDFVSGLEAEFGVAIPDSDLSARKFDTIEKVEAYLEAQGQVAAMAYLRGTGTYLPERVVSNDEMAPLVGESADWIRGVSGIEERRYAAEAETVVDLAECAATDCLTSAGLTAGDIGMLIVSSGSPDRNAPAPASVLAARLGLGSTPTLDVAVPSAGSLIALSIAMQFAPKVGKVLVVASEIMSRCVDRTPDGRNTAILFGDGAGAALIDPQVGALELKDAALFTNGSGADVLFMQGDRLHMDGGSVILRASRKLPAAIQEVLTRNGLTPDAVGHYILHQANLNLLNKVAASLKVPADRFFTNIQRYGNTSSASLLIALHEWQQGTPQPVTAPVILSAFGAGLNWGAILATPA